ncbi:MAG: prepilin-type N-terminal cleavage/methylation domain-containing protein [Planctomycetota bacterium]|nr:prepilin-type N-terminal cleavage/methylation domain-containing protein [Planctomycetota bacterium]
MSRKSGFTLVELVVVVLILGILAAIAVPKILNNGEDAKDSGVAQTLSSIRDAIELYRTLPSSKGVYPNGTTDQIQAQLLPALRGKVFPSARVGVLNSNVIKPVTPLPAVATGTEGWAYDPTTGEIVINSDALNGAGIKYSDL